MRKLYEDKISYHNRKFHSLANTDNGDVGDETIFYYHQEDELIWASYSGGDIKKGFLVGIADINGNLEFSYEHVNMKNEIRTGKCKSYPTVLPDGRLRMKEVWQWTNGDLSSGESELEECITEVTKEGEYND